MSVRRYTGRVLWGGRERDCVREDMRTRCVSSFYTSHTAAHALEHATNCHLPHPACCSAHSVIALDVSPVRLALARHNAALYGVEDRIEFVLADFFSFARTVKQRARRAIDVVFLSPPWGGPSYLSAKSASPSKSQLPTSASSSALACDPHSAASEETHAEYSLEHIRPVHGAELFKIARGLTPNIAYFLPRNSSVDEISRLLADAPNERVEIEEEWMGTKLKALTCYFGGLVAGQEALFDS